MTNYERSIKLTSYLVGFCLIATIMKVLWNHYMPWLFNMPPFDFLDAAGLTLFYLILFEKAPRWPNGCGQA